ncbi:MAG: hypothetical protein DBY30_05060 [Verrucomicrobia bacterium]|nr:MAG: hypothetical protein DBY30_05060 [Verrucomicrobiota bacterium]
MSAEAKTAEKYNNGKQRKNADFVFITIIQIQNTSENFKQLISTGSHPTLFPFRNWKFSDSPRRKSYPRPRPPKIPKPVRGRLLRAAHNEPSRGKPGFGKKISKHSARAAARPSAPAATARKQPP